MTIHLHIVLFWFDDDWGRYGRSYERIAQHLARLSDVASVTVVFPPVQAPAGASGPSLAIRQAGERVTLVTEQLPRGIPRTGLLRRVQSVLRPPIGPLRAFMRRQGANAGNTLLWIFPPHPYIPRLIGQVPHRGVVAHVLDDFTKFHPSHELYGHAVAQYPTIGEWADAIITTAEVNHAKFVAQGGASCHLFTPAVDESFFGAAEPLPCRITGAPPQLGYVGWIMDRTDLALLVHVAQAQPAWRINLAGPEYPAGLVAQSGLLKLPNVRHLGPIPQAEVPSFLRQQDVCLIPHRDDEYSRSMGPLKLYQYLASGRPIVSTPVAGVEQFREHVRIAASREAFVAAIAETLDGDTPRIAAIRIAAARNNTWSLRVREMLDTVARDIFSSEPLPHYGT